MMPFNRFRVVWPVVRLILAECLVVDHFNAEHLASFVNSVNTLSKKMKRSFRTIETQKARRIVVKT